MIYTHSSSPDSTVLVASRESWTALTEDPRYAYHRWRVVIVAALTRDAESGVIRITFDPDMARDVIEASRAR